MSRHRRHPVCEALLAPGAGRQEASRSSSPVSPSFSTTCTAPVRLESSPKQAPEQPQPAPISRVWFSCISSSAGTSPAMPESTRDWLVYTSCAEVPLPSALSGSILQFADFQLDCGRFELRCRDRILRLERKPMELLILLASR